MILNILKNTSIRFGGDMEWDNSDLSRNISNHLHEDEDDAPIPVLSPLETAQAPLEILIDLARTKIESVEFLTRCDTPPPAEIVDYNNALVRRNKLFP